MVERALGAMIVDIDADLMKGIMSPTEAAKLKALFRAIYKHYGAKRLTTADYFSLAFPKKTSRMTTRLCSMSLMCDIGPHLVHKDYHHGQNN